MVFMLPQQVTCDAALTKQFTCLNPNTYECRQHTFICIAQCRHKTTQTAFTVA